MIRETSSTCASSSTRPDRCAEVPTTADPEDIGGPYTLGNEGAVAELGLEPEPSPFSLSPVEVVGESGGKADLADASAMRESDNVKSSD